jgi:hypothetical protein
MARRNRSPGDSRFRPPRSERSGNKIFTPKTSGDFERKCFEFDRKIVTGVLDALRRAIKESATQMKAVAGEQVFDESLSDSFARTARRLNRMLRKLEKLRGDVREATGYPKVVVHFSPEHAVVRRLPTRTWRNERAGTGPPFSVDLQVSARQRRFLKASQFLFQCLGNRQNGFLIECASNDLHPDRETIAVPSSRHHRGGKSRAVDP